MSDWTIELVADFAQALMLALAGAGVLLLCVSLGGGALLGLILAIGIVGMLHVFISRATAMLRAREKAL